MLRPVFLVAFSIAAFAAEPAQVVTWPAPERQFCDSLQQVQDIGSMAGQKTFVTDVTAENISGKLIPDQRFSIYVLDKKQVRIGEAWMQVDNLGRTNQPSSRYRLTRQARLHRCPFSPRRTFRAR